MTVTCRYCGEQYPDPEDLIDGACLDCTDPDDLPDDDEDES